MGIGGGIITKKLLFAVLLIASLSLGGIADASAAEIGTAQTTISNTNTLDENNDNELKSETNGINSAETQKNADTDVKRAKTYESSRSISTQLENTKSGINTTEIKQSENIQKKRSNNNYRYTVTKRISNENSVAKQTTSTAATSDVESPAAVTTQPSSNNSVTTPNTTSNENQEKIQISSENSVVNHNTTASQSTVSNTTTKFDPNGKYAASGTTKYKIVKKITKIKVYKLKKYRYKKWYKYKGKWRYKIYYKYKKVFVGYKYRVKYYKVPISSSTSSANSSSVASLAKSLTSGKTSSYAKAEAIFNWVRNNINYSFYYNTKYGAAGTLKNRKGNCVDHSHLIVALARAAGLQARYVHANAKFTSGNTYGHVWAQILVNGKWVNADATSSRNSLGVIKNWSSAVIKGIYSTLPF